MTKYTIKYTSYFKKSFKKIKKQGKNVDKIIFAINKLANNEELDYKFHNHNLINDKYYKNCWECHIEPDWLLIYRYDYDNLILLLIDTGSHSELF